MKKTLILPDDEIDARIVHPTSGLWRLIGRIALIPFLVYGGMLLLFVIKPFTHVESLRHPLAVAAIQDDSLILEDGPRKTLALVNRLPKDDPIFLSAIKNGVEIDPEGKAFGLLTIYPSCGMTFNRYSTIRVNLRNLAAALDPTGLDESVVSPEMIQYFKESTYPQPNPNRLRDYFLGSIHRVGKNLDYLEARRDKSK